MIPSILPVPFEDERAPEPGICIRYTLRERLSLCACAFFMGVVVGLGLVGAL